MPDEANDGSKLLRCQERICPAQGADIHPGWIRATAILLRGLERLRAIEERKRE